MWVLFKYFIIEYIYCKISGNSTHNENEKEQISAYKLERKSLSFIARELSKSGTVVRNYLKDPESYGNRKCPGRPPKITNAARHRLYREASKGQSSSRDRQKSQNFFLSLQEEFVKFFMNRQISYIKPKWQALLYMLFTNPSARAGYDTRSILKQSLTGFNSEFSFS